jgi:hypothetical protein
MEVKVGEMYFHPLANELVRVIAEHEEDGQTIYTVKTLWRKNDSKLDGRTREVRASSNFFEMMLTYERCKLPIMARIFG